MSGDYRAIPEPNKARAAVAGALTAGALLLAPVGVAIAAPGIANAAPPPPSGPPSGGGVGGEPGGTGAGDGAVHKDIIRLPGLKIEIKNIRGDHKPPKLKIVPFPGLNRLLHPRTGPNVPPPSPTFECSGHGPVDLGEHPECGGGGSGGTG